MRDQADQIGRQEVHGVHQHDPDEHRERERRHEPMTIALMEDAFRLLVYEIDEQLYKGLATGRHTGGGAAHHPPDEADANQTEQDGNDQRVDVQRPEAAMVLAERLGEEAQVMLDIFGRREFGAGSHLSGHQ